jgi:glycosyltransferase involved in cell wall biosynthesis
MKKKISIVTGCYNEEENVAELIGRVQAVMEKHKEYDYEYIFIDNSSTDNTVKVLKEVALKDQRIKIIINSRNFGYIRSPYYGLLQGSGDLVISLVADFQDPPEMISNFIRKWEEGYKVVVGIKTSSKESKYIYFLRSLYYKTIAKLANIELLQHFTGFGAYDKNIIAKLKEMDEPYPYFRGLISEIGFEIAKINYTQPKRKNGYTKSNFYALLDVALLGLTHHTKIPLRFATILGFCTSALSLLSAFVYLVYKVVFWNWFSVGMAPLVIGLFFLGSIQLLFLGLIGEYIGTIFTYSQKRPLVIEKERINFD